MELEELLQQLDVTETEAKVYEAIANGEAHKPVALARRTGIKRPTVYHALDQLVKRGLVREIPKGSTKSYMMSDPEHLRSLENAKEAQLEATKATLETVIPQLISQYKMSTGKPHVQYFEGAKGMKKVLWDTLEASEVIYSYADLESILKNIPKINEEYTILRDKYGIMKKGLLLDTPYTRKAMEGYHSETTQAKFISPEIDEFGTVVQIYDNKVSYITFKEESMIGIIIEDASIYTFHRKLFEYVWNITPEN